MSSVPAAHVEKYVCLGKLSVATQDLQSTFQEGARRTVLLLGVGRKRIKKRADVSFRLSGDWLRKCGHGRSEGLFGTSWEECGARYTVRVKGGARPVCTLRFGAIVRGQDTDEEGVQSGMVERIGGW